MTENKLKVLVADEDKDIRFLIQVYLRDYNIQYFEARDGEECLDLIVLEKPQLLILNFMLEKLTGYQILDILREKNLLSDITVFMMIIEGFDLIEHDKGVNEYIAKPFDRTLFMQAVKHFIDIEQFKKNKTADIDDTGKENKQTDSNDKNKKEADNEGEQIKKILVADDDPFIIKMVQVMLKDKYELVIATTGEELVEKAQQGEYNLIISDVVMPKLSGWKSVKKIREGGYKGPVIFNSGLVKDKELYETLKPDGVSRFILKPFKKEQMLELIKELI